MQEAANKGPMQWSGTAPYMAQELFMKKHYD